jgi:uncharacterized metal-binding protein
MPNAPTHDKIAVISGMALVPVGMGTLMALGETSEQAVAGTAVLVGSHLACSFWLSPDLDLDSAIDDRWGPLRGIWLPYQKFVPHRHWFSHSGVSALLRLLYLALMMGLILMGVSIFIPGAFEAVSNWLVALFYEHPRAMILVAIGAVVSDVVHTGSDHISTRSKRMLGKRRRRSASSARSRPRRKR